MELAPPAQESEDRLQEDRPFELVPDAPRRMLAIPLTSFRGVTLGPSLRRRPGLVAAIRAIPGVGEVRLSPIGGTVGPGGPEWLSVLFAARLPEASPRPLDLLMNVVQAWWQRHLEPLHLDRGRVEGSWCPGFSDLSVGGRKLLGIGFKLRGDRALVRTVLAVSRPSDYQMARLDACHRAFGPGIDPNAMSWLAELVAPGLDPAAVIRKLGAPGSPAEKIFP